MRSSDVNLIKSLHSRALDVFVQLFVEGGELRIYGRTLSAQIQTSALPFYVTRHELDLKILQSRFNGFALVGEAGAGKTTLLQNLTQLQARELANRPSQAYVPVLVSMRNWRKHPPNEVFSVLKESMNDYYPVSEKTIKSLLEQGRLMCIFDAIDEVVTSRQSVESSIKRLHQAYPKNPIIVSSRPVIGSWIKELEIEVMEIPRFSTEEEYRLIELRRELKK